MRMIPCLLVAVALTSAVSAQQLQVTAQLQFGPASALQWPQTAIAAGDLDGDGRADLITLVDAHTPQLFLSEGHRLVDRTAGHVPATNLFFFDLVDLALGDVDGDGDLDLALAKSWEGTVRLLLNNGSAVFTEVTATHVPTLIQFADWVYTVALFDADGDGDLDLFAGVRLGDRLWRNDGTGHFTDITSTHLPVTSRNSWRATVGDFDADGDPDLVTWNAETTPQLLCLRNTGQGGFATHSEPLLVAAEALYGVGIADLDRDGRDDVLTNGGRRLLLGSAAGLVDASATHLPLHAAGTFVIADIDADGDRDVVGAQFLLVNDGTGHFADATAARYQPAASDRALLAAADFDGDRDLDVISMTGWFLSGWTTVVQPRILANLHRHLGAVGDPVRGQAYAVDLFAAPGYCTGTIAALPFLALQPASIVVPDLGTVGLQPAAMTALPIVVAIPAPAGLANFALPIPNWPFLLGLPIHLQALTIDAGLQLRLTNRLDASIH